TKEADIYFLIDGSTSIRKEDFEQIKKFMLATIEMFSIGPDKVRVGVMQYSDESKVEFNITDYPNDIDLRKAVSNIKQVTGGTYTGKALDFTLPLIQDGRKDRTRDVPCYLIVLTDGKSMDGVLDPAERLRTEQITIHAVGIGQAEKTELQQIAGKEERIHFGQNFDSLKTIKNEVVHRICTVKYSVCTGEYRGSTVCVHSTGEVQCVCSDEYRGSEYGGNTVRVCSEHAGCEDMKADIMFLVDSSGSIGHENFEKMKTFMKNLLTEIHVGADKTQIGVVQFSDNPKEEFQLNKYFTQKEISDAIDGMSLIGRNTLTGHALTFIAQYFTHPKGARLGVKKFLILLTDGEAQDDVRDPAKGLRDKGVTIFSVGVYGANRTQLEEISGDGSLVFHVEKFDDLKEIESKLIFRVCALHGKCPC
uniref:Collagen type VI alpha 5 chain n=1 Tax=Otolemur garnettii TaxID=30611 RepID=H0XV84_OTOGA